jgi:preprotein translocase subunit Sec63
MLSYLRSYNTIKSINLTPAYGSTEFIEHESFYLNHLKDKVDQEEYKKLRNGQIQDLTHLINVWKNTPVRERAKVMICSLVCFAAAITLAIIAYHSFAFIILADANQPVATTITATLLMTLSFMASEVPAIIGCQFARWAVCSTKSTITYLEKIKKDLEDEAHVKVRIDALQHVAEERLQQLSEERAACEAAFTRGGSSATLRAALMPLMKSCFNEFKRIRTALSRLGIAIPDAYTQQPVT